jgi:hypothetical protein
MRQLFSPLPLLAAAVMLTAGSASAQSSTTSSSTSYKASSSTTTSSSAASAAPSAPAFNANAVTMSTLNSQCTSVTNAINSGNTAAIDQQYALLKQNLAAVRDNSSGYDFTDPAIVNCVAALNLYQSYNHVKSLYNQDLADAYSWSIGLSAVSAACTIVAGGAAAGAAGVSSAVTTSALNTQIAGAVGVQAGAAAGSTAVSAGTQVMSGVLFFGAETGASSTQVVKMIATVAVSGLVADLAYSYNQKSTQFWAAPGMEKISVIADQANANAAKLLKNLPVDKLKSWWDAIYTWAAKDSGKASHEYQVEQQLNQ